MGSNDIGWVMCGRYKIDSSISTAEDGLGSELKWIIRSIIASGSKRLAAAGDLLDQLEKKVELLNI